ncbi:IclR family transcriptional regulator [Mesorhizobium sp. RP14(2022)]|uniref:IclR family transcriptional regulator n=1 Tax=Mesorhizobium liriopis TaxID=2953882 RepID=A0ABT1C334_9HYPH|nr:IclR family transcriptional regulator C-terminal domain-containing protein [Mesorhizobium liriopis]MCO6049242.1 IclR family transcriptional regulator [Mesorhizobium liriopis]
MALEGDSSQTKPTRSRTGNERSPLFIQSLEKALFVLEAFASAEHLLGLSEISRISGLDKPATQRCVHTLVKTGYLEKDLQSGRFSLGKKVLDLSFHYLRAHPLVLKATPVLLQLRRDCGERTNLSLFDGTSVVYALRLHGKREYPQYSTLIGRRMPTFCSAGGRATLARLPEDEVREILEQSDLRPLTAVTLTDPDEILAKVRHAAQLGYGFVNGESSPGELVVAAPVIDAAGRPIGAVHIAGSGSKWQAEEFERRFAPQAMEAANYLSHSNGTALPSFGGRSADGQSDG